jgi:hypothetical protein
MIPAGLITGCGSSDKSSTGASTGGSSTAAGSTSTPSSTGGAANSPQVQQAVAACKQSINSQPTLSASLKSKLTKLCEKAATGNVADAKKITQEVCTDVVKGANIPAGPARDQALAACKKS